MNKPPSHPDIVVIGASAGGVSALQRIVTALPHDLPAAVFVVLHISADSKALLAPLLARNSALPVETAVDGAPIRRGRVLIAPPDRHLTLDENQVRVTLGPPQNRHRPSIDVLFRSAAVHHGARVIGVVLTGFLNDGTSGLEAIKDFGGVSVVQDPATADVPSMPESALRHVDVDHCVPLQQISQLIVRLTANTRVPGALSMDRVKLHRFEAEADLGDVQNLDKYAKPSSFLCPDCGGGLWELGEDGTRYRCRVGHGYTVEELAESQDQTVEAALWAAARSLEDRAALSRRLAEQWRDRNADEVAEHFQRRSDESSQHAATLRKLLGVPAATESADTLASHTAERLSIRVATLWLRANSDPPNTSERRARGMQSTMPLDPPRAAQLVTIRTNA